MQDSTVFSFPPSFQISTFFTYFNIMIKLVQNEIKNIKHELKTLDSKTTIIFISSIILLVISWYFANPKFFRDSVTFLNQDNLLLEYIIKG